MKTYFQVLWDHSLDKVPSQGMVFSESVLPVGTDKVITGLGFLRGCTCCAVFVTGLPWTTEAVKPSEAIQKLFRQEHLQSSYLLNKGNTHDLNTNGERQVLRYTGKLLKTQTIPYIIIITGTDIMLQLLICTKWDNCMLLLYRCTQRSTNSNLQQMERCHLISIIRGQSKWQFSKTDLCIHKDTASGHLKKHKKLSMKTV